MRTIAIETVLEAATLIGSTVGAAALTVAGLFVERAGLSNALAGQFGIGAWEMAVGGLLLFVGVYLLGYQKLWTGIRERATQ